MRGRSLAVAVIGFSAMIAIPSKSAVAQDSVATPGSVAGTVVETLSREPLAGVTMRLLDAGGQTVATTASDTAGHFLLNAPAPGTYTVRAQRLGFLVAETTPLRVAGGRVTTTLALERQAVVLDSIQVRARSDQSPNSSSQLIIGRLLDDDTNEPLSGGKLQLRDLHDRVLATQVTDRSGRFRFTTPAPGTYAISGERPGFQATRQDSLRFRFGDTVAIQFHMSRRAALLAPVLITASNQPWNGRRDYGRRDALNERMRRFANVKGASFLPHKALAEYAERGFDTPMLVRRLVEEPNWRRPLTCRDRVYYLDGWQYVFGSDVTERWPPDMLDMIEIYLYPTMPAEFISPDPPPGRIRETTPPCEVVSLWSKHRDD